MPTETRATNTSFVAYPSRPTEIDVTVRPAIETVNSLQTKLQFVPWIENDIAGRPLTAPIIAKIDASALIVADISVPNFNVTYEIGYAIGQRKRTYLIRHRAIQWDEDFMRRVGIFDVLGHDTYENSDELAEKLTAIQDHSPLPFKLQLDTRAKTWVLQTPHRTEAMTRIIACVKKELYAFRSFDPSEQGRLPLTETLDEIGVSTGVVVPLLAPHMDDAAVHNIRAAFVAGLAHGMGKVTLILQDGQGPVPLDIRDFAKRYKFPQDIDRLVHVFRDGVDQAFYNSDLADNGGGILEEINLGAPTAENEFQTLAAYYVRTDEFARVLRGEVNLVIGRKGSGKTALFSQVRNSLRRKKSNIVVDLKPEGYQLLKLKDVVLRHLQAGSKAHLIVAFWDYILLLEIAYKLLEKDESGYTGDPQLSRVYLALSEIYQANGYSSEGDFSERLVQLSNRLSADYSAALGQGDSHRLSGDEITRILYTHDIRKLRNTIKEYLALKDETWVLFDNIDKGWSTQGVSPEDVMIIHGLIEAAWKIEREMQNSNLEFHAVIFLRNDVYDTLVRSMPDRGKDIKVSLDWSDPDLLKEILRRRLVYNGLDETASFESLWRQICVSQFEHQDSAEYLIGRSLMRPRYLLLLINHCRGYAVNYGHHVIEEEDIAKGLEAYSNDLVVDTDNELRDVFPVARNLVYQLMAEETDMLSADLEKQFVRAGIPQSDYERATDFLLWYGIIGVLRADGKPAFIFNVGYDITKLKVVRDKEGGDLPIYRVNPAYWPGLGLRH